MWNFTSNAIAGTSGQKSGTPQHSQASSECSDDEVSSNTSREEGLECPICCESFNIVENVPYVLWCGHTLCKNCILALQWAVVKFPTLPIQLPLFISCPWCHILSFRLVYKGNLKFPRKNFFLLWMVESLNGDRVKSHSHSHSHSHSSFSGTNRAVWPSNNSLFPGIQPNHVNTRRVPQSNHQEQRRPDPDNVSLGTSYLSMGSLHSSLCKSLLFFVNITAKFPLVVVFLLIILYAVPVSAAILVMYILVTVLFAFPSFLILCFAYPSLDWLVREIIT